MPRAIMAGMSDEAFWESLHYRPMHEVDGVLAERMTEVFIDAFAAAALLRRPMATSRATVVNGDWRHSWAAPRQGARDRPRSQPTLV